MGLVLFNLASICNSTDWLHRPLGLTPIGYTGKWHHSGVNHEKCFRMKKNKKSESPKRMPEPIHTPEPPQQMDPSVIPHKGKVPHLKKEKGKSDHNRPGKKG